MLRRTFVAVKSACKPNLFRPYSLPASFIPRLQSLSRPNPFHVNEAKKANLIVSELLLKKYPFLLPYDGTGKIAYALRDESPEKCIDSGGLYAHIKDMWVANNGNGNNTGSVCLSLLPEVAAIFLQHARNTDAKKAYIYAFQLQGKLFLPGSPFCQIISPGALALPSSWVAREVLSIGHDGHIQFGPMKGHIEESHFLSSGNKFKEFCNGSLYRPKDESLGEAAAEFDIQHTLESGALQEQVEKHFADYCTISPTSPDLSGGSRGADS